MPITNKKCQLDPFQNGIQRIRQLPVKHMWQINTPLQSCVLSMVQKQQSLEVYLAQIIQVASKMPTVDDALLR